MTMKGLVSYPEGLLKLEEVPVPRVGENPFAPRDVLVEVQYCGICGSDIHRWKADKTGVKTPPRKVVVGHEIVSVVREIGKDVKRVKPGDRVVHEIVTFYCGRCPACREGPILPREGGSQDMRSGPSNSSTGSRRTFLGKCDEQFISTNRFLGSTKPRTRKWREKPMLLIRQRKQ